MRNVHRNCWKQDTGFLITKEESLQISTETFAKHEIENEIDRMVHDHQEPPNVVVELRLRIPMNLIIAEVKRIVSCR